MEEEKYARRRAVFALPYPMNLLLTINEDVFACEPLAVEDIIKDNQKGNIFQNGL